MASRKRKLTGSTDSSPEQSNDTNAKQSKIEISALPDTVLARVFHFVRYDFVAEGFSLLATRSMSAEQEAQAALSTDPTWTDDAVDAIVTQLFDHKAADDNVRDLLNRLTSDDGPFGPIILAEEAANADPLISNNDPFGNIVLAEEAANTGSDDDADDDNGFGGGGVPPAALHPFADTNLHKEHVWMRARKRFLRQSKMLKLRMKVMRKMQRVCRAWFRLIHNFIPPVSTASKDAGALVSELLDNVLDRPLERSRTWHRVVFASPSKGPKSIISNAVIRRFVDQKGSSGLRLAIFLRALFNHHHDFLLNAFNIPSNVSIYHRPARTEVAVYICQQIKEEIFRAAKAGTTRRSSRWFNDALKNKGNRRFSDWINAASSLVEKPPKTWGAKRGTFQMFHHALLNFLQSEFATVVGEIRNNSMEFMNRRRALILCRFMSLLFLYGMLEQTVLYDCLDELLNLKDCQNADVAGACILVILLYCGVRLAYTTRKQKFKFRSEEKAEEGQVKSAEAYIMELISAPSFRASPVITSALRWYHQSRIVGFRLNLNRPRFHWAILDFAHEMTHRKIRRCFRLVLSELLRLGKEDDRFRIPLCKYGLPGVIKVSHEEDKLEPVISKFEKDFPQVGIIFVILPSRSETSDIRPSIHRVLKRHGMIFQEIIWWNLLYYFQKARDPASECLKSIAKYLNVQARNASYHVQQKIFDALICNRTVEDYAGLSQEITVLPPPSENAVVSEVVDITEYMISCVEANGDDESDYYSCDEELETC